MQVPIFIKMITTQYHDGHTDHSSVLFIHRSQGFSIFRTPSPAAAPCALALPCCGALAPECALAHLFCQPTDRAIERWQLVQAIGIDPCLLVERSQPKQGGADQ